MGGNAIKRSTRMSPEKFQQYSLEVQGIFWNRLPMADVKFIPAYRQKESFGDIDVLIDRVCSIEEIKEWFNSDEVIKNGNVISFAYHQEETVVQIDLIYQSRETIDFAYGYFAQNDLGNLIGRIFHKIGMKFGHDGVFLPMRDGTNQFHEILLTREFAYALNVVGLDYNRWKKGFDTLEDIFTFVRTSPYFNSSIYTFDNLNAVSRIRDKKRATYNAFLEYNRLFPLEKHTFVKDKSYYLPLVFHHFPDAANEYFTTWENKRKALASKELFNGLLVREWTGLQGKELGQFMKFLRENVDALKTPEKILELDGEGMKTIIMHYFSIYQKISLLIVTNDLDSM
jgi:hypothetical protein